ncbi:hypothetical protein C1Y35_21970 [Pseudomonas sp. GW456-L14]|nr:hypothetical protein C1Y35_21970 [Pseudomonas sp. GW456-L14]PMY46359.1 hypothetical protein C1Y34_32050 [Pseudomonas sp. GW456-L12]
MEKGEYPFSGELGNALHERAFNKDHVSVVDFHNFSSAFDYAAKINHAGWSERETRQKLKEWQGGFTLGQGEDVYCENKKRLLSGQLDRWAMLGSDERELVESPFPVVYGFKISDGGEGRIIKAGSDIPGEFGVRGGVSLDEIKVIYTRDEFVEKIKSIIGGAAILVSVKGFSTITKSV